MPNHPRRNWAKGWSFDQSRSTATHADTGATILFSPAHPLGQVQDEPQLIATLTAKSGHAAALQVLSRLKREAIVIAGFNKVGQALANVGVSAEAADKALRINPRK